MGNEVRLIISDALAKELEDLANSGLIWEEMCAFKEAAEMVKKQPSIDPESLRPKGQWIVYRKHIVSRNQYLDDTYYIQTTCSECCFCIQADGASFGYPEPNTTNYCPNCGAKMEGQKCLTTEY